MSISCHAIDTVALRGKGGDNARGWLVARLPRTRNDLSYGVGELDVLSESGASTGTYQGPVGAPTGSGSLVVILVEREPGLAAGLFIFWPPVFMSYSGFLHRLPAGGTVVKSEPLSPSTIAPDQSAVVGSMVSRIRKMLSAGKPA